MKFSSANDFCSNQRVLIFGCGAMAEIFLTNFDLSTESVLGFVETEKSSDRFAGGGGISIGISANRFFQ